MTPAEAKELTLIKWRFRRDHPINQIPGGLMAKLIRFPATCPLCALFGDADCYGCPIVIDGVRCGAGIYKRWLEAFEGRNWDLANYFAGEIVKQIEKWEV